MRYTAMGEEISPDSAIVQASLALDKAALFAQTNKDVHALIDIAKVWMDVSEYMANNGHKAAGSVLRQNDKSDFGFKPKELLSKDGE